MVTSGDIIFGEILERCSKYKDDESYVYKLCRNVHVHSTELDEKTSIVMDEKQNDWLIIMQKLVDTKTNEARKGVINKNCAKFRADRLKVVDIINVYDPKRILSNGYVTNEYENILT